MGLDEAANRLQGTEGTTLELDVRRRDGTFQSFHLVRRHVEVESVTKAKIVDPTDGIGYLQLTGFQKTSADEIDRAIDYAHRQGMQDPGDRSSGQSGRLAERGRRDRRSVHRLGPDRLDARTCPGADPDPDRGRSCPWRMPLYVLVDHDSASASEILAGALQDHQRATIVGSRTYGKGSVQSIFSLRSAPAGLKLTTAKFYSPRNRPYSEQGVQPDIPSSHAPRPSRSTMAQIREEANRGDPAVDRCSPRPSARPRSVSKAVDEVGFSPAARQILPQVSTPRPQPRHSRSAESNRTITCGRIPDAGNVVLDNVAGSHCR